MVVAYVVVHVQNKVKCKIILKDQKKYDRCAKNLSRNIQCYIVMRFFGCRD